MPLRNHLQVEVTGVTGGGADGVIHMPLIGRHLSSRVTQPAQGHLDVANAQGDAVVQVFEFAFCPDLNRPALTTVFLADAETLGVVAVGAEWRGATRSNPLVATGMAFFLLFHAFLEGFEDRKSTRLNSSHVRISYAVFCLKKKIKN